MSQFIGQITVILDADSAPDADDRLRSFARHIEDYWPEVIFADHNGDVESYEDAAEIAAPSPIRRFDGYEIHGVAEFADGKGGTFCEQVPDPDAAFFSLYGHIPGQGLECIGDFKTRELAEEVYARITGQSYATTGKDSQ